MKSYTVKQKVLYQKVFHTESGERMNEKEKKKLKPEGQRELPEFEVSVINPGFTGP